MDQQKIISVPVLFSFLLFILILLKLFKKNNNFNPPPGPWKLPIIGNIHQLGGDTLHRRLRELAKTYGPIMGIKLGQCQFVVVSSPEIAKEIMKIQDPVFADRPPVLTGELVLYNRNDIIFGSYGDQWRQMRKFCTLELLSAKRVQSFRSVRKEEVAEFVKMVKSKAGSPVNLSHALFALTNSIITRNAVGEKCKRQEDFLRVIDDIILISGGVSIVDIFPSLKWIHSIVGGEYKKICKLHKETDEILREIVMEHKARREETAKKGIKKESDNLLDVLLDLQQSENHEVPLTDTAIKAVIIDMFGAGSDTVSKTAEWAMAELMRNPDIMKKAQQELRSIFGENGYVEEAKFDEIKYLKLIIKETFRLHPAATVIPRMCREKTKVNGYDVAPNTRIFINVWALERDPKIWKDAHKFDPERFIDNPIDYKGTNFEFIPFGAGKRICPGITLGTINLELFLANLLYHFDWKFPEGITTENLNMDEVFGGVVKRKVDLTLIPVPFYPLV